jgi:hypothetical protein
MSIPTTRLFAEIRDAARHDLERLTEQTKLDGTNGPTEEELATMQLIEHSLQLTILAVDNFLDE